MWCTVVLLRSVDFPPEFQKNELKSGVGEFDGEVRWVHFKNKIETFTSICAHDLETALSNPAGIPEHAIFQLRAKLREICNAEIKDIGDIPVTIGCNFPIQFNTTVKSHLSSTWVPWFDPKTSTIHVYCFEESPGYANKKVKISSTFEWRFFTERMERQKSNCLAFEKIPNKIENIKTLVDLFGIIDDHNLCKGCEGSKQLEMLEKERDGNIYKTKDGRDAVAKENETFRSADFNILVAKGCMECQACKKCQRYIRTLISRKNHQHDKLLANERLDYKTKDELLLIARESAATIKKLQTKNKRLETAMEDMIELGPKSNSILQQIFNDLYTGLKEIKRRA